MTDSLCPHGLNHTLPVHHQLLELAQNSCPSSRWCHPPSLTQWTCKLWELVMDRESWHAAVHRTRLSNLTEFNCRVMWIVRGNTERFHVSFTHCPLPLYHIVQNFIDNVTTMILTRYNQERRYFHLLKDPSCWPIIPTSLASHPDPLLNAPPQLLCNVFSTSIIMSSQICQINGIVQYEKKE